MHFWNEKANKTSITIKKVDQDGKSLAGAWFTIQKQDGEHSGQYVRIQNGETAYGGSYSFETDKSGEIVVKRLEPGTYKIVETKSPDGYKLPNPHEWTVRVSQDQEYTLGPIRNEKDETKYLTFRKIDKDSRIGLEGFKFNIKEKSLREEYINVYPDYFNPSYNLYKDPEGNANFYAGDSHCEILLKPDDYLYESRRENRWEVVRQERKTREVPDGVDENGKPKTRTEVYYEPVYGWVSHVVEWTCASHKYKYGEFQQSTGQSHCNRYNQRKASVKSTLRQNMERFHAARENVARQLCPRITDKNGYANLSALRVSGDDKHGLFYMEEIGVGNNPYYDIPSNSYIGNLSDTNTSKFNIDYLTQTNLIVRENERARMDLEGFVWEDKPFSGKEYTTNFQGKGIYNSNIEKLIYPVEVALYYGNTPSGNKSVVTSDGHYRLRVNVKEFRNHPDAKVVFIYNGLKYESVYDNDWRNGGKVKPEILSNDNGTKALESTAERDNFNSSLTTIKSDNGNFASSKSINGNKTINYNENSPEKYKSTIKYEGNVSGGGFPSMNCDPIGDGNYSVSPMPKSNQLDPNTNRQENINPYDDGMSNNCYYVNGKTGGDRYQIKADTTSAGYNLYQKWQQLVQGQGLDTIGKINLGLVEREQPDIAIKNDIYAVMISSNTESNKQEKWFMYGQNMKEVESDQSAKKSRPNGDQSLGLKFGNNSKIGTYTRDVAPSEVQVAASTDFKVKVVYKTKIKNESSTLTMSPTEIVSYFDTKYLSDVKCVSEHPWDGTGNKMNVTWRVDNYNSSYYKRAYGTTTETIGPQDSKDMYTEYTFDRGPALAILNGSQDSVIFYNQVEINAYTTTDNRSDRRREIGNQYAGVDSDSNPGNAKDEQSDPSLSTWQDDTDDAPDFKLQRAQNRTISGQVFIDDIEGTNLQPGATYAGNGKKDSGEKGVSGVQVELVELDDNGNEELWENDTNPDGMKPGSPTRKKGTTKVELDENPNDSSGTVQALTTTNANGEYKFSGFIPGRYVIKYTWGGNKTAYKSFVYDGNANPDPNSTSDNTEWLYPEQYKSTKFENEDRYNYYTSGGSNPNRWILRSDYNGMSNAIDDMEERYSIDQKMLVVDGTNTGLDPTTGKVTTSPTDQSGNYIDIAEKATIMHSKTPAFEVGVEALDKNMDKSEQIGSEDLKYNNGKVEQGSEQKNLNVQNLDFGISERPKMGMTLDKEIERVKVTLANGQTLVDTEVDNDSQTLKGVIIGTTLTPRSSEIGTLKVEMDQEIMQGATIEITYKYIIKNTSYKDYVVSNEDNPVILGDPNALYGNPYHFNNNITKNKYYKFNTTGSESEVEIKPTIIADYLSNKMNYLRETEGSDKAPEENKYWERIANTEQATRIQNHFFDYRNTFLYNKYSSRYEDIDYTYTNVKTDLNARMAALDKYYWTLVRDQSSSGAASGDQISLTAGKTNEDIGKPIKLVASKVLTSTNGDMEFYNSAEIIQLNKTGGAQPENQIAGNSFPLEELKQDVYEPNLRPSTVEGDSTTAQRATITGPTGDIDNNYEKGVMTAVALAGLSILGIGTAIIRRIVFTIENRKHKKTK